MLKNPVCLCELTSYEQGQCQGHILRSKVIYLFTSKPGWDPGEALFEGFFFRCLATWVVNSIPAEPVPHVDKVLIVDIVEFSGTFTD